MIGDNEPPGEAEQEVFPTVTMTFARLALIVMGAFWLGFAFAWQVASVW